MILQSVFNASLMHAVIGKMSSARYWNVGGRSLMGLCFLFLGCATDDAQPSVASRPTAQPAQLNPSKSVPSSNVSRVQAWKDAEKIAQRGEGRVSASGSGGSMQPVYGDNTMIVISKISYEELQAGMTIAYMNRKGHRVVHQLKEKTPRGWRVQGLNNDAEDTEMVTRDNLLGVVYASFTTEEP